MRNRTRVIAAAAVTATLAAGSTAAAMASTAGAKPGAQAKTASVSGKCPTDTDLAARLGVSQARLDQALRTVKTSLGKGGTQPAEGQVDAALARILGVGQARVRQAFAAEATCSSKPAGSKAADSRAAAAKAAAAKAGSKAGSESAVQADEDAFTAAVAGELHVSKARVSAALRPLFAAGPADSSAFASAARSLGVSSQQLSAALAQAKLGLAGRS